MADLNRSIQLEPGENGDSSVPEFLSRGPGSPPPRQGCSALPRCCRQQGQKQAVLVGRSRGRAVGELGPVSCLSAQRRAERRMGMVFLVPFPLWRVDGTLLPQMGIKLNECGGVGGGAREG